MRIHIIMYEIVDQKLGFGRRRQRTERGRKLKMGGKHSRNKGFSFERLIANLLKEIFPDARRLLENHKDDCNGVDIAHTGIFKFQCKKLKTYAPINRIYEIKCDRELGDIPVLVTAGDREETMAALPLKDLLWLIKKTKISTNGLSV